MPEEVEVLASIDESLKRLAEREEEGEEVSAERTQLLKAIRRPSRYVTEGADPSLVEHVAKGGGYDVGVGTGAGEKSAAILPRWSKQGGLGDVMRKALAEGTPASGGYLVPVEVAAEVLRQVRARSAISRLGPRFVPVKKELDVTSIASGATAYYVAENAAIPVSEQTFAQAVLLRPKELAALVPISNRLLRDAAENPSVEEVIRSDVAEVLALRETSRSSPGPGPAASRSA